MDGWRTRLELQTGGRNCGSEPGMAKAALPRERGMDGPQLGTSRGAHQPTRPLERHEARLMS